MSDNKKIHSSIANNLAKIVTEISEVKSEDLGMVAQQLVESGLDLEKLERLTKLANKASSIIGGDDRVAYHY